MRVIRSWGALSKGPVIERLPSPYACYRTPWRPPQIPLHPSARRGLATAVHPACPLAEVNPEPKLDADIIGIEVIFPVGKEVVGGDGHEEMRINGEVVPDKPLEAEPGPEDQGRIIFAEAGVDKFEPEVRASVGDRPSLQERPAWNMVFRKAPEPVARELIEIARYFGKPADLQILLRKVAKAAIDIQYHPLAFYQFE